MALVVVNNNMVVDFSIVHKKLDAILRGLLAIEQKENKIMATLEEVKGQVVNLNTLLDGYRSAVALIKEELEALKSGEQLAPSVAAKVDEISALITETQNENFPPIEPTV